MATKNKPAGPEALKQITYLPSALKAPRITEAAARLADHARERRALTGLPVLGR